MEVHGGLVIAGMIAAYIIGVTNGRHWQRIDERKSARWEREDKRLESEEREAAEEAKREAESMKRWDETLSEAERNSPPRE